MQSTRIEISYKTIFFISIFLFFLWFIYQLRDVIVLLFVAFIIMSILRPLVDWLESYKIPRPAAVFVLYLILFIILGGLGGIITQPLVSQSARLMQRLPLYLSSLLASLNIDPGIVSTEIANLSGNIVSVTLGIFNNILAVLTVLVFAFYFLLERKHLYGYLNNLIGETGAKRVFKIVGDIEDRLGAWARGQLLLATIIGITSYFGLTLLGLDYALPLALIAGILEIVPIIGPIISAVPAIIVALVTSPLLALTTAALYIVIQQLENNLIVPLVLRKAVGLPPLVTILALMIGGRIGGIAGAIIAVPVVVVLQIVISDLYKFTHDKSYN